jgi:hypothetical protein
MAFDMSVLMQEIEAVGRPLLKRSISRKDGFDENQKKRKTDANTNTKKIFDYEKICENDCYRKQSKYEGPFGSQSWKRLTL